MKYIVNENKWLRGIGDLDSRLLNKEGKMCCLGFVALQCGYKEDDIDNVATPSDVFPSDFIKNLWPKWILASSSSEDSLEAHKLMSINDDESKSDDIRKKEIQEIFVKNDDEIIFINE